MRLLRSLVAFAALAVALLLCVEDADARLEGELSAGRGEPIFMSPISSEFAPVVVASLDHTSAGQQSGSLGGLFNRPGLVGGFAAGFLGAGLLGLFFGHGVFGGLGGVASYLGLLCQLALIAMLARLIWSWWSGRNAPAFAGLSPRQLADPYLRSRNEAFPGNTIADLAMGDEEALPADTTSALGDPK
ncbi:MAG TPA: hypothetical protein VMR17_10855 [Xanthobacteraceae bacterium]|jgi:hypothetical protein|nr:hypothetical protein [Xanthobacteraceae bacterium]